MRKTALRIIVLSMVMALLLISLSSCNFQLIDTKWQFNYAYITFPNGEIMEVEIEKWTEDGNSVTIQCKDGNVYSVSYHNCFLTKNRLESEE